MASRLDLLEDACGRSNDEKSGKCGIQELIAVISHGTIRLNL
jgi:hypothetical protein